MKRRFSGWIASQKRWSRMIGGKRHYISAKKLGCPETAEGSYQAARAYFKRLEAELTASTGNPAQWAALAVEAALRLLKGQPEAQQAIPWLAKLEGIPETTRHLLGCSLIGQEEYEKQAGQPANYLPDNAPIPQEYSLKYRVSAYLAEMQIQVKNGVLSAGSFNQYQGAISAFVDWAGKNWDVRQTSVKTLNDYFAHVSSLNLSNARKKILFYSLKRLVKDWSENGLCSLPATISSRKYSFNIDSANADKWSPATFKEAYNSTDEMGKLILCLAANCGCYGSDMAAIKYSGGNTIKRGRVKTGKKSPAITYHLWPETIDLLKKHGSKLPDMYKKELGPFPKRVVWSGFA